MIHQTLPSDPCVQGKATTVLIPVLFFNGRQLTMWQVSSGAIDLAKTNLQSMLAMCASQIPPEKATEELLAAQERSLRDVTHELVRQVTSPNTLVRETVRLGPSSFMCS